MGYGDALMASAHARYLSSGTGQKVAFGDGKKIYHGRPEVEVFAHNPNIAMQKDVDAGHPVLWFENYSGHRPYINRDLMMQEFAELFPGESFTMKKRNPKLPWRFTPWRIRDVGAGQIYFTDAEKRWALKNMPPRPFIVMEPTTKGGASPNKNWDIMKYGRVANALVNRYTIVQFNGSSLPAAMSIRTASFRHACGILSYASMYIGTEGGLHHAAAALGIPAVVYHGGYISPETTGYDFQVPIYVESIMVKDQLINSPCGMRVDCDHCKAIANSISPADFIEAVEQAEREYHGRHSGC